MKCQGPPSAGGNITTVTLKNDSIRHPLVIEVDVKAMETLTRVANVFKVLVNILLGYTPLAFCEILPNS